MKTEDFLKLSTIFGTPSFTKALILLQDRDMSVSELSRNLNLSIPAVLNLVKKLMDKNLVKTYVKENRQRYVSSLIKMEIKSENDKLVIKIF